MSKLKMESEICFNIWFFVNLRTKFSNEWRAKTYNIGGSDSYKSSILKQLAETDMVNADAYWVRKSCRIVKGDKSLEGVLPLGMIQNDFETSSDYYFTEIEKKMPINYSFDSAGLEFIKNNPSLGDSPYFVLTLVFQNEEGEFMPYTSEGNRIWCNEQANKYGWENAQSLPFI